MYKVSGQLNSSYGTDSPNNKSGPDMPVVTVGDKRLTNVKMANGECIQGIRRNQDIGCSVAPVPGDVMSCEVPGLKPLRYTPGLNCDSHLESLRPERNKKHPPIQGGDQWKKKLIQHPNTYEGSFLDADMQQFRPNPNTEDPWMISRLPDSGNVGLDRLAMPSAMYYGPNLSPYEQIYPQDELSQIKMRNRRFQNSCAMESQRGPMMRGQPMYAPMGAMGAFPMQPQPMMMMMPPPVPAVMPCAAVPAAASPLPCQQQMCQQQSQTQMDDLAMLDQELNMTRRTTRPFMPTNTPEYFQLQKQVDLMEQEPLPSVRKPTEPVTSVDQLPPPKKVVKAPLTEAAAPSLRPQMGIADQIAIRSFVLGQKLPRIGGSRPEQEEQQAE